MSIREQDSAAVAKCTNLASELESRRPSGRHRLALTTCSHRREFPIAVVSQCGRRGPQRNHTGR